jgi:diacylglycerol O-acyltransferase / wax synthase
MGSATGRLAPVDEANLVLDHVGQVNVFLIAGVLAPGGFVGSDGRPDMPALRTSLQERIAGLPALRLVPVADGRRHRWVEKSPDIERHVRLVTSVEGLAGLERFCGELMIVPLALDRPLWELLLVPGVAARQVGVVLRIHHAIADGMTAVAIAQQLFEHDEADAAPAAVSSASSAPSAPVTSPAPATDVRAHRVPGAVRMLGRLGFGLRRILTTLVGRGIGPTLLLGERSPQRGVAFVDADLGALEAHVRPLGATVNDALLAAIAAGYVAALPAAGEELPYELPVSVPVALRRRGTSGNQVGVMLVRLPLGERDPDVRLRLIAARTRGEKVRAREQGTLELMRGPRGARIMDRVAHRQHVVAGFVTNVHGPSGRLRLAGAPVEAIWPVAVLAANVRLGVAAVSYAGRLRCGVHFDEANVPGAVFAQAMRDELRRLAG